MELFLIAFSTVAIAEMGDRTQLLSLVLAAKFRKPWAIIAAISLATLANHALAGVVGIWVGHYLTPALLNTIIGLSMLAMAVWALIPDKLADGTRNGSRGAFVTTLIAFFVAEIGDKTQVATVALAAGYNNLSTVIAGTTMGMLAANIPVVFLGSKFASRLPIKKMHFAASALFICLGLYVLWLGHSKWI